MTRVEVETILHGESCSDAFLDPGNLSYRCEFMPT